MIETTVVAIVLMGAFALVQKKTKKPKKVKVKAKRTY